MADNVAALEGAAKGHTPSGHQWAFKAHAYAQELKLRGVQIYFVWSPGHSNIYRNEIADQLAGEAALTPELANTTVNATSWAWLKA
jgi:ribonuclease HI